ncbi:SIMPL domain-containing protein [Patescibacteria group bacterium]|nr:SIMPL domain-containing protein [Patescibacteria group bacterium]
MEQIDSTSACCLSWRSPKTILSLVGLVLLAGILVLALLRDRFVNQPQWQVNVTGQGRVSYQPDIANVTLGVQVDKVATAAKALQELNDKMVKVIAAAKAAGINETDIQTQSYYLNPQYDYKDGVTVPSGYSANQQLIVKVNEIAGDSTKVAKVIAGATEAGANQVTGISFETSNLENLKEEARLKAIVDAKTKSVKLSAAAGVTLGEVVGWWENLIQVPGQPMPYYDGKGGMGSAGSPQLPSGSQEVVIEVNLNYKIK